jgi:thiopurine S-methyltransferase
VSGVEISAIAVEALFMEHRILARRRVLDKFDLYEATSLRVFRGDFFSLDPALLGSVAAVYDRAALISWAPEMRTRYVQHIAALTLRGAQTLLVVVEFPQGQMAGPPFPVTEKDIDQLYGGDHAIEQLARQDILDIEPRHRARGLTELREVCYRLTRK